MTQTQEQLGYFVVDLADGSHHRVPLGYGEMMALEREFGISSSELQDEDNLKITWLLFMAHRSMVRHDRFEGDLDAFADAIVNITSEQKGGGSAPLAQMVSEASKAKEEQGPGSFFAPGSSPTS